MFDRGVRVVVSSHLSSTPDDPSARGEGRSEVPTRQVFPFPSKAALLEQLRRIAHEIDELDRAISQSIKNTPTPALDPLLRWLADASSYWRLWLGVSGVLALTAGSRGRAGALRALTAVAITSVTTDFVAKTHFPRRRPSRVGTEPQREVRRPSSSSFPSGHTASGFAFATVISQEFPLLALPTAALAAAVGYSRIHSGVHYPSDVIVGAVIGTSVGSLVAALRPTSTARTAAN